MDGFDLGDIGINVGNIPNGTSIVNKVQSTFSNIVSWFTDNTNGKLEGLKGSFMNTPIFWIIFVIIVFLLIKFLWRYIRYSFIRNLAWMVFGGLLTFVIINFIV